MDCSCKREAWEKSACGAESARAYLLLQEMLVESGTSPDGLVISTDEHGKPSLNADVSFSLSHSKGLIVCALATDGGARRIPIGADVERMGERNTEQMMRIAERWFSDGEKELFLQDPSEERFLSIWTAKEAMTKYFGRGLAILRDCDVTSRTSVRLLTERTEDAVVTLAIPEMDDRGEPYTVRWVL
jgi:phosphopantetheine--protein transferase-like protein